MSPDPVRPDPATRDLMRQAFHEAAGLDSFLPDEAYDEAYDEAFDAWLATTFPPPLPDEPPDGTVLAGGGPNAWVRDDASGAAGEPISRWWMTGKRKAHTWEEALQHGADPRRQLLKLPDPEEATQKAIEDEIEAMKQRGESHCEDALWYLAAIRTVAERGNHDG